MARLDFKSDADNDLLIENGDFVIGDCTMIQAKTILESAKGEIRQYPLIGANFTRLLGSKADDNIIYNLAKTELERDGLILDNLEVNRNSPTDYNINISFKRN